MWKSIRTMLKMTHKHKKLYYLAYIVMFFGVLLALFRTYLVKIIINALENVDSTLKFDIFLTNFFGGKEGILNNIWPFIITLLVITTLKTIFDFIRGLIRAKVNTSIAKENQMKLFYHIERLPYAYLKKAQNGDIIQRCTQDEETVRLFVINQLLSIVNTIFTVLCVSIILFSIDWRIGISALAFMPLLFVYSYFLIKKVRLRYRKTDESEGIMTANIQENLTAIRVVKAYNREQYEVEKFEEKLQDYKTKFIRWRVLSSTFFSTSDIFIFGQMVLSLILGVYLVSKGQSDIGTLQLTISYVWMIVWPIRDLAMILSNLQKSVVGMERIQEIINEPIEDLEEGFKPQISGNIEFRNVSFKFEDSNQNFIDNLSLKINAGETIAIMGKTGSGKSTIAHLLNRLYDCNEGEILIDDINIKDISKHHIRQQVATVLQEPFLFSKTIINNIRIARKDASDEQVYKAAKIASIHHNINDFAQGYETPVGERGVTLSGGQKQRIAIARTVISESPVLIFDDSLSAVDTETDIQIRLALKQRVKNTTTIIITHRVATAQDADKIIVLGEGKIEQIGKHEELINQEGLYKRVYDIQSRMV